MSDRKTSFHIKLRNDLLATLRTTSAKQNKSMTRIIEDSLDLTFGNTEAAADKRKRTIAAAGLQ